jgi:hypothetical protein
MTISLSLFLVSLGAVLRLNRLFIDDTITQPIRDLWIKLARSSNSRASSIGAWFHELWTCPWCLGMWISAGVASLAYVSDGAAWFFLPALALSLSWLAAIGYMFQEWMNGE